MDSTTGSGRTGVYVITCVPSGKQYVGSSAVSIGARWAAHRCALIHGYHGSRHLQNAWNKYGQEAFRFEVLQVCAPSDCIVREQYWMDTLQPAFNTRTLADSNVGTIPSVETRRKIALKARDRGAEHWLRGESHPQAVLTERAVLSVLRMFADGKRQSEIVRETGIGRVAVHNIVTGKKWKHLHPGASILRHDSRGLPGESGTNAKLTVEDAIGVLQDYGLGKDVPILAAELAVAPGTLYNLIGGRTWIGVSNRLDEAREQAIKARQEWQKNQEELRALAAIRKRVGGKRTLKTHCKRGHCYDGENTYITRRGFRQCRSCVREAGRRYEGKQKAKRKAAAS